MQTTKQTIEQLAAIIARDLMTNGTGEVATHLQIHNESHYLGSWRLDSLTSQIAKHLRGDSQAIPDEPAWLSRLANGNSNMSEYIAKEIAAEVREMFIYKRAMESMARQMIHPKMTAKEMAELQLKGREIK